MVIKEICSFQLNQVVPLDKWKTTILTKIKATMPGQETAAAAGAGAEKQEEELL